LILCHVVDSYVGDHYLCVVQGADDHVRRVDGRAGRKDKNYAVVVLDSYYSFYSAVFDFFRLSETVAEKADEVLGAAPYLIFFLMPDGANA
jgi:hypothetical protein